jgi:signal transduction histidine kinase
MRPRGGPQMDANGITPKPMGPFSRRFRALPRRARWSSDFLRAETRRTLPIVLPVAGAGAFAAAAAIHDLVVDWPGGSTMAGVAGLLVAATLAEAFPLPIEGVKGTTSLAIVFIVATAAIYGWPEAVVVGLLSIALVELERKRPPIRAIFNVGLYVSAAALAGLAAAHWRGGDLADIVVAGFLGSAAFYGVDMLLLSGVIARVRSENYFAMLARYVTTTVLPFLVIASLTVTLVVLWDRSPFVSLVVVGPLITIALYERWLHRALERLREFDRLKDEFIAVISHELRTPLTSVYGAALTLQKHEVRDETREALLTIVSDEAARLARLLDDVLSASRLDAKTERFDITPTDAAKVAQAAVDAVGPRLPEGLDLALVVEPGLPLVAADEDKLRQILVNLRENAIKYSPDGGRIEIGLSRHDSVVRFRVRDEGLGIAEDELAQIFDRFHRVDPNMTRGVGGTGLGLYICRELVEAMHGRMWVTSTEGEGSTFAFELPVA